MGEKKIGNRGHFKIAFIFDFIELNLEETSGSQELILAQIIPVGPEGVV